MSHSARRRFAAGCLTLLACLVAAMMPSAAQAGRYTQILCVNPANGQGVSPNGQLPDGMSNPSHFTTMALVGTTGRCGVGDGLWLPTDVDNTKAATGAALSYNAGPDVRFVSARIYRRFTKPGAWGLFLHRSGSWWNMYANPWTERCDVNCSGLGVDGGRFVPGNLKGIVAGTESTNGFHLSVLCEASNLGNCPADGTKGLRFWGGTIELEDASNPQVVGAPSGDLLDEEPLWGEREVTVNGSDIGSGLYRVRLLIDDEPTVTQTVDDNLGRCVDADPADAAGDPYQFTSRVPCKRLAGGTYEFDTTVLPDGSANLKVQLEDASGNVTTVVNKDVTIDNVPAPSYVDVPVVSGSARRGSSLSVTPATFDDHGLEGEPSVTRVWQRCAADGSACLDIAGADGLTYTVQDADLNRTLRVVETAVNSEGSTSVAGTVSERATREDGTLPADNDGLDNDGDGTVDESGEANPVVPPPGNAGTSQIGARGIGGAAGRDGVDGRSSSSAAAASAGPVNGEGASARATLTAAFVKGGSAGRLAYGKTLTVTGRLVDESGRPIRNAIIDIDETPAINGARAASARPAVTGADGSFTYSATGKAGTRSVSFSYRYQREGAVVSRATLSLTVKAAVKLAVRLKGVVATYSGRVLAGSMPKGGKLVVVQGRAKGGSWQTFATRKAGKNGAFKGRYRLKVRRPGKKLQFRVRVLTESGWNFGSATSKAVTRTVR